MGSKTMYTLIMFWAQTVARRRFCAACYGRSWRTQHIAGILTKKTRHFHESSCLSAGIRTLNRFDISHEKLMSGFLTKETCACVFFLNRDISEIFQNVKSRDILTGFVIFFRVR